MRGPSRTGHKKDDSDDQRTGCGWVKYVLYFIYIGCSDPVRRRNKESESLHYQNSRQVPYVQAAELH